MAIHRSFSDGDPGTLPKQPWRYGVCRDDQPLIVFNMHCSSNLSQMEKGCQHGLTLMRYLSLLLQDSPRDEEGILKSVEKVHEMIDKEVATGISPNKIFVCGFSQGGALSLASAMLYPKTLGGAAVLSGYMPFNSSFIEKISSEAKQTPVVWFHGMSDNVVDFSAGQAGPPLLEQANISCQFKAYPGLGHSVSPDELTSLESWIKYRLQSSFD